MEKRRRGKKVAQRRRPTTVGAKQLSAVQSGGEGAAPAIPSSQLGDVGRNDSGGGGRDTALPGVGDGMARDVRSVPPDSPSRPAAEELFLGHWPYTRVSTAEDVAALGEWLLRLGGEIEKVPMGLSAGLHELALATKERGWLIPRNTPASPLIAPMLSKLLLAERTAPALVVRDIALTATSLDSWFGPDYDRISFLANIVHEMRALEYATGRPVLRMGDISPLQDALDASMVGPMMALEAPRFYRDVGLPLGRHLAQTLPPIAHDGVIDPDWHRWTVVYDWLLFRVLTHYTHDPTLTRWFQEEQNPLTELGRLLDLPTEQTVAFVLWMCCGEDESMLSKLYPDWAARLPESPQLVKAARADKHIPTLRLGLVRMVERYAMERRAMTLYGRLAPWGLPPHELLHYTIMGSINDILDVAAVSIINLGSSAHWLMMESDSGYNRWLRAVLVGYTRREPLGWQDELSQLAPLNNPLGMVTLGPKVMVE